MFGELGGGEIENRCGCCHGEYLCFGWVCIWVWKTVQHASMPLTDELHELAVYFFDVVLNVAVHLLL